jgi:thioredoxin 1
MSGKAVEVTDANWEEQVVKSEKAVIVDFWAPWCAPCHMVTPALESIAEKMQDTLKVCKLNVDESPGVAQTYGIRSIPTLMLFKDGQVGFRIVGVRPQAEIEKEIDSALK